MKMGFDDFDVITGQSIPYKAEAKAGKSENFLLRYPHVRWWDVRGHQGQKQSSDPIRKRKILGRSNLTIKWRDRRRAYNLLGLVSKSCLRYLIPKEVESCATPTEWSLILFNR